MAKDLTDHLLKARCFPLRTTHCNLESTSDKIFSEIKTQIPKPPLRERVMRAWVSGETWAAMDARVTARQEGAQKIVRHISQRTPAGLSTDQKRRADEAGHTIESLLASDPPLVREAWVRMRECYRDVANRPPPPERVYLEALTEERVEIYAHNPPPRQPIPIEVAPFPVYDNIPGEEEISKAVLQLRLHRAGGPSGISSKHLRMWLRAEIWEEDTNL